MMVFVRIWILLAAFLVAAGWILSAIHSLNRAGYLIAIGIAIITLFFFRRFISWPSSENIRRTFWRIWRRCHRPAPFLFAILALLTLISGLLYAPYNSDTYSYRLPRIMHWLGHEGWHWIRTGDQRMNVIAPGYEWIATPVILFTGTDRFLFVINWIPYLMAPGLIFAVLRYFGVAGRVAWWWAWVLASGWCYVLQAASVVNDQFSLVFAQGAVALAMKSRETGRMGDFWISMLAAALMTGVKQTNIPLVAIWLVFAAPQFASALRRPFQMAAVLPLAILVSSIPTMLLNIHYAGNWSGLNLIQADYPDWRMELKSPFWGIVGNAFALPLQNLAPPFFPGSATWNKAMDKFVQTGFGSHFQSFEGFGHLSSGMSESSAGIGLAITLLTILSFAAAWMFSRTMPAERAAGSRSWLRFLPWLILPVFMAKAGEAQNARYLAPYYVFFFPTMLVWRGHLRLVQKGWWRALVLLCMVSSACLVVVNTKRPLFPARTILANLAASHPKSHSIALLNRAYSDTSSLSNLKQALDQTLPSDETLVGYAAVRNNEAEMALWLPMSSRRVERVVRTDTPLDLSERRIHWVVIQDAPSVDCPDLSVWMKKYNATLVSDIPFHGHTMGQGDTMSHVYVLRLHNS